MAIGFPAAPSWEPLRKGLAKGGVEGLNTILLYGQEKNQLVNSTIYFSFLSLFQLYCRQNNGFIPPHALPPFAPLIHTIIHCVRLFLVG
jgi:hypothetical protein